MILLKTVIRFVDILDELWKIIFLKYYNECSEQFYWKVFEFETIRNCSICKLFDVKKTEQKVLKIKVKVQNKSLPNKILKWKIHSKHSNMKLLHNF